MSTETSGPKFTDIIIAIHGIGAQHRFETVRSVATRMANSKRLLEGVPNRPVAPQPLGYFHSDVKKLTSVCLLDDAGSLKDTDLTSIGFAEVFWADIPQEVVKEGRTLEETKAWARTVVARADALCKRAKDENRPGIIPPDFNLAGEILDEIIETVYVLENLFFLAGKAGIFKFNLREVLEEYLGDVQIVTEFSYYRSDIIGRFHSAMDSIYQQHCKKDPNVRLHVVAHSEGTVVSFLAMLHAMSGRTFLPAQPPVQPDATTNEGEIPEWLKRVRGYMTIGSPIDKHLLMWPRLWEKLDPKLANDAFRAEPIRWRNYYDYGDPVGFKLDSTRLWLAQKGCSTFQFCGCSKCGHDIGFARYLFPGEAHNEYWHDPEVFEHFITHAVRPGDNPAVRPGDKRTVRWLSPLLPYLLSVVLLAIGVFVLYKGVHAYTHPSFDPLQRFVRFTQLGIKPAPEPSGGDILRTVAGVTVLIAGATLLARFPRLAIGPCWRNLKHRRFMQPLKRFPTLASGPTWTAAGMAAFVVSCLLYAAIVPHEVRDEIGANFSYLRNYVGEWAQTFGTFGVAAVAGMSGYLAMSRSVGDTDRRQRWLLRGMRPLILCGAVAVGVIVLLQMMPRRINHRMLSESGLSTIRGEQVEVIQKANLTAGELKQVVDARGTNWMETLEKVNPVLAVHAPAWPVILAGVAFLYFWWLATLVFDLAFVWHRYIRHSVTNDRLRDWNPYGFSMTPVGGDEERCCTPPSH